MSNSLVKAACGLVAAAVVAAASVLPAQAAPPPGDPDSLDAFVDAMTLEQLVGQMTWTHVYGSSPDDASMAASNQARYGVDTPAEVIEKYDLGGVLYFAWSNPVVTNDPTGTARLSNGLQEASTGEDGSGVPLAVTIDQEGGIVARMGAPMTVFPGTMALGATFDEDLAYEQGRILGEELAAVGVNVDFAPVVDVNTNPDNPVIGIRSFGEDPQAVGALGASMITGMQEQHVAAAAKHFPGHGDTNVDSHTGLPIITYDRAVLDKHLIPFEKAIDEGVDMIMSAHVIVEAIDPDMPGTLSPKVLTELLRNELGFTGLITTDALDMAALKQLPERPLDDGDIAVLAIQAGSDILLNSPDVDASIEAIREAVEAEELTRERLEESVTRILEWKIERGIWDDSPLVDVDAVSSIVGQSANQGVADRIAQEAITLVQNDDGLLPLNKDRYTLLVVGSGAARPGTLVEVMEEQDWGVTGDLFSPTSPTQDYIDRVVASADHYDAIIFTSMNGSADPMQQKMVAAVAETGIPVIVVGARNPYDAGVFPTAAAVLNSYGWGAIHYEAVEQVISGKFSPTGQLPVAINDADGNELYPLGHGLDYLDCSVTLSTAGRKLLGERTNAWGSALGCEGAPVRILVEGDGEDNVVAEGVVGANGQYIIPLDDLAARGTYRLVAVVGDNASDSAELTLINRSSSSAAPATLVGRNSAVWGSVDTDEPVRVWTEVRLPDGGWSRSQQTTTDATGGYLLPLTYGRNSKGTLTWRVVVDHGGFIEYTPAFTQQRLAAPSVNTAGQAPVGRTANVWGTVDSQANARVWTEVLLPNGTWARSQASTTNANGGYVIALTYGQHARGTTTWRVAAEYDGFGVLRSREFTVARR